MAQKLSHTNIADKQKSVVLLKEHLPSWADCSLKENPAASISIYRGRINNPKPCLYSSFRLYLLSKNINEPIPPRTFGHELDLYLQTKKLNAFKHRNNTGLILQGVELLE